MTSLLNENSSVMSIRVVSLLALVACAVAVSGKALVEPQEVVLPAVLDDVSVREARSVKASYDQSKTIGGVYQWDRQLQSKTVYRSSTILTVHKENLNYSSAATIHCIQIVDLQKNGKNADFAVQSGGIGQRNVSIRFKSQRGEKINYLVIIWGA